jgi:hypothetical protein
MHISAGLPELSAPVDSKPCPPLQAANTCFNSQCLHCGVGGNFKWLMAFNSTRAYLAIDSINYTLCCIGPMLKHFSFLRPVSALPGLLQYSYHI